MTLNVTLTFKWPCEGKKCILTLKWAYVSNQSTHSDLISHKDIFYCKFRLKVITSGFQGHTSGLRVTTLIYDLFEKFEMLMAFIFRALSIRDLEFDLKMILWRSKMYFNTKMSISQQPMNAQWPNFAQRQVLFYVKSQGHHFLFSRSHFRFTCNSLNI